MKDKITSTRKLKNKIFTAIGLILLLFSIFLATFDYYLEQKAINISATIISIDYEEHHNKALVRYQVEGNNYEQNISLPSNSNYSVKDSVKIKYDIDNPNKLIKNDHQIIIAIIIILSLIILVISLPRFISYSRNQRRIKKLYKEGLYINADIVDVFVNNNGKKVKNILPYRLRCKYLNPQDNKEYIYESEDVYTNPLEVIKKYNTTKAIVLIDKTNPNNYYLDLGSLAPKIKLIDPKEFMSTKK